MFTKEKWILLILLILSGTPKAIAQQDPLYTQYMFNTLAYNPAYAGTRDMVSLMALSRHQWVGFEGAPSTQTITGHTPVGKNIGLGLTLIHDKVKPTSQTGLYFDYAYRIKISEKSKLSFGLKGGFNYFQLDMSKLHTVTPEDDPTLNVGSTSKYLPNFGFGIFFYADRYFVGFSAPKLLENKLLDSDNEILGQSGSEVRHYFITGGYVFNLSDEIKFKPTFMSQLTEAAPMSLDLNANFLFKEKLWIGALYRLNNSFGAIVQYQFTPQFKVGYGFDMTTNALSNYNSGTHEIMISYELNFTKEQVENPRYF